MYRLPETHKGTSRYLQTLVSITFFFFFCPELSFNARLSQHKEVYTVLIKAGPGAKPDQREVTCIGSWHRDQVPLGLITLETHLPYTRLLPSSRSLQAGWASGHQGSLWENRVPG